MPQTNPPTPPPFPPPACDRDARYLEAAGRGALTLVTEYGATRYCEDRSAPHTGYLAPPPPELFTAGWLTRDGHSIAITAEGRTALTDYRRRRRRSALHPDAQPVPR